MAKRVVVSVLIVLGMGLGLGLPQAGAGLGKKKYGTKISISYSSDAVAFTGKVKADVPRCFRDRTVTVFAKTMGGEPAEFGTDRTDGQGRYEIPAPLLPGAAYYAKVDRKVSPSTVCLGAKTGDVAR